MKTLSLVFILSDSRSWKCHPSLYRWGWSPAAPRAPRGSPTWSTQRAPRCRPTPALFAEHHIKRSGCAGAVLCRFLLWSGQGNPCARSQTSPTPFHSPALCPAGNRGSRSIRARRRHRGTHHRAQSNQNTQTHLYPSWKIHYFIISVF